MTIEDAWNEATEYLIDEDYPVIVFAIRNLALAILEEVEGMALASADIAVNDHFVEYAIIPLRAHIEALGEGHDN